MKLWEKVLSYKLLQMLTQSSQLLSAKFRLTGLRLGLWLGLVKVHVAVHIFRLSNLRTIEPLD